MTQPEQLQVDLTMAHTYIPAIGCMLRSSALILVVANTSIIQSPPSMMLIVGLLLVDRFTRSELIFDSNAIPLTLAVSYATDMVRIRSEEQLLLNIPSAYWIKGACSWLCLALSCLLIVEPDQLRAGPVTIQSPVFLALQSALVLALCQTPLQDEHRDHHDQVMSRSFLFLSICIAWTYTVGVHNMVGLLNSATRLPIHSITRTKPGGRRQTSSSIVQCFVPCLVRFGGILFLNGLTEQLLCILSVVLLSLKIGTMTLQNSHPEYTTTRVKPPISIPDDSELLFVQQDTERVGNTRMSIRNTPFYGEPPRHSPAAKGADNPQPKQEDGPPRPQPAPKPHDSAGDEDVQMFAMAMKQAKLGQSH